MKGTIKVSITWGAFVAAVVTWLVLTPISALVIAKLCTALWGLLLAPQYGAGPSYESWYGIACLVSWATIHLPWEKKEDTGPIAGVFNRVVSMWIAMLFSVLVAMFVRFVLGWP